MTHFDLLCLTTATRVFISDHNLTPVKREQSPCLTRMRLWPM